MNSELYDLVKVEDKYFKYWEEADIFTVQKIFNFSDHYSEYYLTECLHSIYVETNIGNNKYINNSILNVSGYSSLMRSIIDLYIESDLAYKDVTSSPDDIDLKEAHQLLFLLLSHSAIKIFNNLKNDESYCSMFQNNLSQKYVYETVAKKQRDYGPNNIAKFGIFGLVVRVHDKIARLENLMSSKRSGINSVSGETIFDTLFDIIGYSTVAIMWINGWFLHPMEIDSK